MKISEILKNKSTISFEVFPPKNKEGDISSIYSTIEGLAKLSRILLVLHMVQVDLQKVRQ